MSNQFLVLNLQIILLEQENIALRYELERLREISTRDRLTGLPNGRALSEAYEILTSELARARVSEATLVFIDLVGFKRVNDMLGHARGDAAICETASALQASARQSDTVARLHEGGDEFVVLLPGASLDVAMHVVSRMQRAVRALRADGLESDPSLEDVVLDLSFGLCHITHGNPPDLASALAIADREMYASRGENIR